MSKKNHSVIVVRKKKSHKHAHHGGSWKIAYADFMTAMMAFFLVMWLLATSTPTQRHSIAEYFNMPLKVALSSGDRTSLSDSIIPGGGDDVMKQEGEVMKAELNKLPVNRDHKSLSDARKKLEEMIRVDPRLKEFKENVRLSMTEDGLLIQIIDSEERPMFKIGSKVLEPYMTEILHSLVPVITKIPNRISITGHTDSVPYAQGEKGYSNWELSSDRANASRRALIAGGMTGEKFLRVVGMANTLSLTTKTPQDHINRRISILVMKQSKEQEILNRDAILHELVSEEGEAQKNVLYHVKNSIVAGDENIVIRDNDATLR